VRYYPSNHYILMNDIDLNGVNWEPFGSFSGSFDGNGHTIYNFNINKSGSDNVGFFSVIGRGAEVRNLTLENYVVTGRQNVGGLAGQNHGYITGCSARGSIDGSYYQVGGLVSYNEGTIENSNATGSVTGGDSNSVGGLVGYNKGGTITGCYATGDVYSNWVRVGGLVGLNEKGSITASYAAGNVSSKDNSLRGLVGRNYDGGTIANCYATGKVTSQNKNDAGGLVGENSGNTSSITTCYAIGAVSGGAGSLGGLVGKNSNSGPISSSYYNTDTCGDGANNGIGIGKTTIELKQQATFVGWNFADGGIWRIAEGYTYPVLQWQPAPLVITTTTLEGGMVGTPYSQILACTGDEPITWTVDSGNLPDGLSLTGNTISGTPTMAGNFSFTVKATNEAGSATKELNIVISAASTDKTLISITAPEAISGLDNGTEKTAEGLGLPAKVTLVTNDGNVEADVTWDVDSCDYDPDDVEEQTFSVTGTVTLPDGVINPNNVELIVSISVTVNKAFIDECFIATAAYGSKFDPAVTLLRQFRDSKLLTNQGGRYFVKLYYSYSPAITKVIAGNEMLRLAVRIALLPVIGLAWVVMHNYVALVILLMMLLIWMKRRHKVQSN
jgi:hypothetical protein